MLAFEHRRLSGNSSQITSPVTLDHDWPTLARLAFVVISSIIGCVANGYFISSFMVERAMRKVGNAYLAAVGFADMIITAIVMPISATVLLSGQWDNLGVCKTILYFAEISTYAYNVLFALVGAEAYYRLCRTPAEYNIFLKIKVSIVIVLVYALCAVVAGVGVFMPLDYDYCRRQYEGNHTFRLATFVLLHALPFALAVYTLFSASCTVKHRGRTEINYRRSRQYDRDCTATNVNILAYSFYTVLWLPYLIIVHRYPETSNVRYYYAAWIAAMRPVFGSFLYCGVSSQFRRAFIHIFFYCCCKTNIGDSLNNRHRRNLEFRPTGTTGEVKVHIMHQAIVNSPQRATTSPREAYEL